MKTTTLFLLIFVSLNSYAKSFGFIEKIRTGNELTVWVKKHGDVKFPPLMEEYGYTTTVKAMARVNREINIMEFIGVSEPTHIAFIEELSRARMPFVNPSLLECDTLYYTFDFSTLLPKRHNMQRIESYETPRLASGEPSYLWIKEVLGEDYCKQLYLCRDRYIGVTIKIDSMGEATLEKLFTKRTPLIGRFESSSRKWSATKINGRYITMSHDVVFDVERLLTAEQRHAIDSNIYRDSTGLIYNCTVNIEAIDQLPYIDAGSVDDLDFVKRVRLTSLAEDKKSSSEKLFIPTKSTNDFKVYSGSMTSDYFSSHFMLMADSHSKIINTNSYSIKNTMYQNADGIDFKNYVETAGRNTKPQQAPISFVVKVSFVVDTSGEVSDIEIIKSSYERLSAQATQLIKGSSGMWTPAIHEGKYVKCRFAVDVDFRKSE